MANTSPFWSLSDSYRPKPNYFVDRTGPDWALVTFRTKKLAEEFASKNKITRMKPVKVKNLDHLLGLLKLLQDINPNIKDVAYISEDGRKNIVLSEAARER